MRAFIKISGFLLVCTAIYGGYRGYKHWSDADAADQQRVAKKKEWVYAQIQEPATGSHSLMVTVAREFTGESNADIGPCDWSAAPKWGNSFTNPHWLGHAEGSSGMRVWCNAEVKGLSDDLPAGIELQYQWDWQDGAGVTAFAWRWDPDMNSGSGE